MQQAQGQGFADFQFTLVTLHIGSIHVLQVELERLACGQPLELIVPVAALDKTGVPVRTFKLPACLCAQAQRMGCVVGLIVERSQMTIEPLIQLCAGKMLAEHLVGESGLLHSCFRVSELQAQHRVLLFVGLQLQVGLNELLTALLQGLGPLLDAAVEQRCTIQMTGIGAFLISHISGRSLNRIKGAFIAHPAVGSAENIGCLHRQPCSSLGYGCFGFPLCAFKILLAGLCFGWRDTFIEQFFEILLAAYQYLATGQQRLAVGFVSPHALALLIDGDSGEVPGMLLL